jgi:hypothetical protein
MGRHTISSASRTSPRPDPIETRPGFAALLDRVENNGVKVVLVEDASRFARDLVAQELGVLILIKRGMRVDRPGAAITSTRPKSSAGVIAQGRGPVRRARLSVGGRQALCAVGNRVDGE